MQLARNGTQNGEDVMKAHSEPRLREPTHRMRMVLRFRQTPRTQRDRDGPVPRNYEKLSRKCQPIVEDKPCRRVTRATLSYGSETILLVEHDVAMREVIRQVLQKAGYQVLQAINEEEARQTAARYHGMIHLLMTDTDLPQISGRHLAMQLTARYPQMKVLYVAGRAFAVKRYGLLGLATNWLQRPFSMTVMIRKVREILDQRVGFCS